MKANCQEIGRGIGKSMGKQNIICRTLKHLHFLQPTPVTFLSLKNYFAVVQPYAKFMQQNTTKVSGKCK